MPRSEDFNAYVEQLDDNVAVFRTRHDAIVTQTAAANPDAHAAYAERQVLRGHIARTREHLLSMKRSAELYLATPRKR